MKAAYDAGVNFFDTAEGYAGGKSEIVMGKAIKHFGWKQSDLVISTKVGSTVSSIFKILTLQFYRSISAKTMLKMSTILLTTAVSHASILPKASINLSLASIYLMSILSMLTGPTDRLPCTRSCAASTT